MRSLVIAELGHAHARTDLVAEVQALAAAGADVVSIPASVGAAPLSAAIAECRVPIEVVVAGADDVAVAAAAGAAVVRAVSAAVRPSLADLPAGVVVTVTANVEPPPPGSGDRRTPAEMAADDLGVALDALRGLRPDFATVADAGADQAPTALLASALLRSTGALAETDTPVSVSLGGGPLAGDLGAVAIAALAGATLVRTRDPGPTRRVLAVSAAIHSRGPRRSGALRGGTSPDDG